jgi:hypothetical protein
MMSNFAKRLNVFISVLIILGTAGCATTDYTTHYGIFTAENSAGELRQFRIHWQTLRYEGWAENTFRALPVVLETQCSKRKLYFYDSAYGQSRRCLGGDKEGIYYCADSNVDMDRHGLDLEDDVVCGTVTDQFGSTDIRSLEGDVLITLSCRPKQSFKKVKGKKKSIDFLLNSELPYIVTTKQVKGRDLDLVIPSLSRHSSICDLDS